jgi:hypothetical protein
MSQLEVDKIIPQSGTTLTIGDSGDTISIPSGATLSGSLNADNLDSGTVPDARITGAYTGITNLTMSGDLTVDTNTLFVDASANAVVVGGTDASSWNTNADELVVAGASAGGMTFYNPTQTNIFFADGTTGFDVSRGRIQYIHSGDSLLFGTDATERMRIDSSGHVLVGTSDALAGVVGSSSKGISLRSEGYIFASIPNDAPLTINRQTSDGNIAQFRKDGVTVGSIGTHNGDKIIIGSFGGSNPAGLKFQTQSAPFVAPCTSTGANSDNVQNLGHTSARWKDLYLSGGVYLGGTGSANKLDDYEEGTWTPSLETGTITTDASGYYTKIGRLVYINFIAGGFSDTTSTNAVRITNLPFTNSSFVGSNDNYGYVMSRYLNISDQSITGYIGGGTSTMIFYINGNGGASDNWIGVTHNQIGSGAYFRVGAVYLTDA